MNHIIMMLILFIFLGCSDGNVDERSMVYYGDINNDTVLGIDVESMELLEIIASNGVKPYEIAKGDENLYVINRNDYTTGILNTKIGSIDNEIVLNFKPRSLSINADDILFSSVDEPSSALVTNGIVSNSYSDSSYILPTSFGGTNATGHPVWIDDNYFLLLDRTENTIEVYLKGVSLPISKLVTSSSVHHVMNRDGIYYGIAEGKQGGVSPGVVKFTVSDGSISLIKEQLLSTLIGLPSDFNSSIWGAHHGALYPSADYIYIGSAEGNVFVLDLANLALVDTFKSGKGIGHFLFYNDMLITTNHYDTFKSFYDASDPRANVLIKELSFSTEVYPGITMQSHSSHILDDKLYFTFNTSTDSTLYKIDLTNITIEDSLVLRGRYCLMGSFVKNVLNGM
ncbi:MAG: hypothetical protein Q9M34_01805 [Sulfurimonas sp.]|nr:hypothetical protein [Sulfurimonas sp.]